MQDKRDFTTERHGKSLKSKAKEKRRETRFTAKSLRTPVKQLQISHKATKGTEARQKKYITTERHGIALKIEDERQ